MDSASKKTVKLPTFDALREHFQLFWMRMRAHATVHKFLPAMSPWKETDLPDTEDKVIDKTTVEGKKKEAAKKRNQVAITSFTMAFQTEGLMGIINKACTQDPKILSQE